jgi:hypothetical protein
MVRPQAAEKAGQPSNTKPMARMDQENGEISYLKKKGISSAPPAVGVNRAKSGVGSKPSVQ